MKGIKTLFAAIALTLAASAGAQTLKMTNQAVRIVAYESFTSVNLVIVKPELKLDVLDPSVFTVETNGVARNVRIVYTCDDRGEWTDNGDYLAFGLELSRERGVAPLVTRGMGTWSTAYPVKVALKPGKSIKAAGKKYTAVDCSTDHALRNFLSESDFFRRGTFTGPYTGRPGDVTLTYGAYEPEALRIDGKRNPLIIWLHGMGEGGTDVSIELMGNEVVSLIRNDIQSHFTTEGGEKGIYVLAVQCPTMWMDTSKGMGTGAYPSLYSDVLKSCIDNYLAQNPDVDPYRIYIGGCSNGGFMTMDLILHYPGYFAAAYPICEMFEPELISDEKLEGIRDLPMWFIYAADDNTVVPALYEEPLLKRLEAIGAKDIRVTVFPDVHDTSGKYEKDGKPYPYYGHWSWLYFFNNECFDEDISVWQWLSEQRRQAM